MQSPITALHIIPGYGFGFRFFWSIDPTFHAAAPWTFWVEQGETADGPWLAMSPELKAVDSWYNEGHLVVPQDPTLYYRVRMVAEKREYTSPVIMPYGELSRREFLLVQEMQRKELLVQSGMQGVQGYMWSRAIWGPVCRTCRDFATGDVLMHDCPQCLSVGRIPGYHGPYPVWLTFAPMKRNKDMQADQTQTREEYTCSFRTIGAPRLKKLDILVDTTSDKRYHVGEVTNAVEMRRVPVVQEVAVTEIPTSHKEYYTLVVPQ